MMAFLPVALAVALIGIRSQLLRAIIVKYP
jgi:hypothetical protein